MATGMAWDIAVAPAGIQNRGAPVMNRKANPSRTTTISASSMKTAGSPNVLDGVDRILKRSRWMRFTLSYTRGRWFAVIHHERGKIYGKAWRLDPKNAVFAAVSEADMATLHLSSE